MHYILYFQFQFRFLLFYYLNIHFSDFCLILWRMFVLLRQNKISYAHCATAKKNKRRFWMENNYQAAVVVAYLLY